MSVRDLYKAVLVSSAFAAGAAAQGPDLPPVPVVPPLTPPPIIGIAPPAAAPAPTVDALPPLVVPPDAKPKAAPKVDVSPKPVEADIAEPVVEAVPVKATAKQVPAVPAVRETAKPIPHEPFVPATPTPVPPDAPKVTGPSTAGRAVLEMKAGRDTADATAALDRALADAKAKLGTVREYSAHQIRQERVNGKMGPEITSEFHARAETPGVAVRVIAPQALAGTTASWQAGKFAGKVLLTPPAAERPTVLDPADAKLEMRAPLPEQGLAKAAESVAKAVATERRLRHPVQVLASDYRYAGRAVTKFEITAERPHALRTAARIVAYFDAETKLPVRVEYYADPSPGNPAGELLASYSYINVKVNGGLPESAFGR